MRRVLVLPVVAALALALLVLSPPGVRAEHCSRVIIFTGVSAQGQAARPNIGAVGCASPAAHGNTSRITPGSNSAAVRVLQSAKDPLPVAGTFSLADKTTELNLKPNRESSPSQFDSQEIPIGAAGDKAVAEVFFDDGSVIKVTYTR